MSIAEDGTFFGYVSGGCAETAIAAEAVKAIKQGRNFATRFGVGSPYLDIQLPCGAGIDIWFDQTISAALVEDVVRNIQKRQPVCVETCVAPLAETSRIVLPDGDMKAGSFRRWYYPNRQIYIIGAGPSVPALARLAIAANHDVTVLSPDDRTLDELSDLAIHATRLTDISQIQLLDRDPFTALVLLFHEHEREAEILKEFIHSDVFFLGALGSKRTQEIRLDLLRSAGIEDRYIERIHGPVGLDIRSQTPEEIALSILAQITAVYHANERPLIEWSGGPLT